MALYVAELAARMNAIDAPSPGFFITGSAVTIALTMLGLVASFFHLGRPERAWRAVVMWRTSWLSREVIVLPAFMAAVFMYGLGHTLGWSRTPAVGAITLLLCLALFLCTGMIYACLKFLQEWHTPLTPINYFLLGSASGFTLAAAISVFAALALISFYVWCAALLTLAAWISRYASLLRNARLKPVSTVQTAIGIKHPRIVQKSMGFMGGSFNTRHFFHGRAPHFLRAVRVSFLILTFPVPLALLLATNVWSAAVLLPAAVVIQYLGLLMERWFFFAQANHPQNLYYQAIS